MTKRETDQIWGWEPLLDEAIQGQHRPESEINDTWNKIDNWWKCWSIDHPDQPEALRALLEELRRIAPTTVTENGVERFERHLNSQDIDESGKWLGPAHLQRAAEILQIGELEATLEATDEGYPLSSIATWLDYRSSIEEHLNDLIQKDEVTKGDEELSRKKHSEEAIKLLQGIDRWSKWAHAQLEPNDEHIWLHEVIAEISRHAFDAGRRTQAASGKEFEKHAAVRLQSIQKLAHHNEGRRAWNEQKQAQALRWQEHVDMLLASNPRADLSDSARANFILQNWTRAGRRAEHPKPPAKRTLVSYLSARGKHPK